jgi:hypothetical protein
MTLTCPVLSRASIYVSASRLEDPHNTQVHSSYPLRATVQAVDVSASRSSIHQEGHLVRAHCSP